MKLPIAAVLLGLPALDAASAPTALTARADCVIGCARSARVLLPSSGDVSRQWHLRDGNLAGPGRYCGSRLKRSLQPTDAIDQLEKQLGLMRAYLAQKHSELQQFERVRTLKTPQAGKEDSDSLPRRTQTLGNRAPQQRGRALAVSLRLLAQD